MSCNSKEQNCSESFLLVPENSINLHILKDLSKSPSKVMGADKSISDLHVQTNGTQTNSSNTRICSTCLSEYIIVGRDNNVDEPEFSIVCRICRLEGGLYHIRKQLKSLEDCNEELKQEISKLHQDNNELKWKCHELEGCVEYLESHIEHNRAVDISIECSEPSPKHQTPPGIDVTDWIDFSPDCFNNPKNSLYVPSPRRTSSTSPCPSLVCSQHCLSSCASSSWSKEECNHLQSNCCRIQENGTNFEQGFGNKVLIIGCSVIKHVWGGGVKNMARQSISHIDIRSFNNACIENISEEAIKLTKNGDYKGIIVHAGGNDLAETSSAELVSHKVGAMLEQIKLSVPKGTKIMFSSILPRSGMSWEWNRKTNVTNCCCMRACQVRGFAFLDNYSAFWTDGSVNKEYLSRDGIHLSKLGSRALATNFSIGIRVLFCKDARDSRVILPRN